MKKSSMVIPRPSQSFLIVETVALRFRPVTILFTVDYLIAYAWHPGSNARDLVEYAERMKKESVKITMRFFWVV